jgi:hypothetical protein
VDIENDGMALLLPLLPPVPPTPPPPPAPIVMPMLAPVAAMVFDAEYT